MTIEKLSKGLTVKDGGLYTSDVAALYGVSRPKAWKAMRALELAGVVEGYAEKCGTGDSVERKDDGRPATVGAEIRWFAPMVGDCEGETDRSRAAAAAIHAALVTTK